MDSPDYNEYDEDEYDENEDYDENDEENEYGDEHYDQDVITDANGISWWQNPEDKWWWYRSPGEEWTDKPCKINFTKLVDTTRYQGGWWPREAACERRARDRQSLLTAAQAYQQSLVAGINAHKSEVTRLRQQQAYAISLQQQSTMQFQEMKEMLTIAMHRAKSSNVPQPLSIDTLGQKAEKDMQAIEERFAGISAQLQRIASDTEALRAKVKQTKTDVCCRFFLAGNCSKGTECPFLHPRSVPPAPPGLDKGKGKSKGKAPATPTKAEDLFPPEPREERRRELAKQQQQQQQLRDPTEQPLPSPFAATNMSTLACGSMSRKEALEASECMKTSALRPEAVQGNQVFTGELPQPTSNAGTSSTVAPSAPIKLGRSPGGLNF